MKRMRFLSTLSFSLLIVLLLPCVMAGFLTYANNTTYYISPDGNDNSNGTGSSTAWKTIAKVNSINFLPGDKILFEGGKTFAGNIVLTNDDQGVAGSPITVGSYGTGRATLDGGTGIALYWVNASYCVVESLIVKGIGSTNRGSGVKILNTNPGNNKQTYVRVNNVTAYGFSFDPTQNDVFNGNGIFVGGLAADGSKSGFTDVRITNCTAYGNDRNGICLSGYWHDTPTTYANSNVYIGGCTAYNNLGRSDYTVNWSGNGIFVEDTDGATIERCIAYGNGANNPDIPGGPTGIWTAVSNNVTIQYCESYDNLSGGGDGGGYDLDGGTRNAIIQYCYSHGNKGAGYLLYEYTGSPWTMRNLTCRYNISENDAWGNLGAAIYVKFNVNCDSLYIYGNTLWNKGISIYNANLTNSKVLNNIAPSGSLGPSTQAGNWWYNTAGSAGLTNPGQGGTIGNANNLTSLTAYKLTSGSRCINAGVNPVSYGINPGTKDFYQNSIPYDGAYDIGAHEYQVSVPDTQALNISLESYAGANQTPVVVEKGFVEGCLQAVDRTDSYIGVPASLSGCTYLRTARNDKLDAAAENDVFYQVGLSAACTVYVPVQSGQALPVWISGDNWTDAGLTVTINSFAHNIYSKVFPSGTAGLKRAKNEAVQGTGYIFKLSAYPLSIKSARLKASELEISVNPNPFNPSTLIRINGLHKSALSGIRVAVYDLKGARVAELFPDYTGGFAWNAKGHNSGVYLAKAVVGNQTVMKKIILVR